MKFLFVTTVPITFGFCEQYIMDLKSLGHECIIASSDIDALKDLAHKWGLNYVYLPLYRGMNPMKDVKAIVKTRDELSRLKPDVLIAATPKAAMVSMIAGKISGIKNRVYHIFGLPFETAVGLKRKLLLQIEKLTGKFATGVIPIGSSVLESIQEQKIFAPAKLHLTGLLTTGGVDLKRFDPDALKGIGQNIRRQHGIKDTDVVIGYVARFTQDKGFIDLTEIWEKIKGNNNVHILLAGEMDSRAPLPNQILDDFINQDRVHYLGYREDIESIFAAMDIFLFPSYREGFGNVNLEASAMRVPVITYNVTGCKDAVQNNITGYVVPFKDYESIVLKINELIDNPSIRKKFGEQGRSMVQKYFTTKIVGQNLIAALNTIIK
ncbi:MAG: glycosyltransferase family 4 protein [Muribaculaceae bacterium]|nr:glycosyltransferase family 4 protein [Muribaculaceae bacterium]